jgi:hypothetical protein
MVAILCALASIFEFRARSRASLELELIALRHQVTVLRRQRPGRPQLSSLDRLLWVWLYRVWPQVIDAMVLVKPATVVQWHRKRFRLWRQQKFDISGGRHRRAIDETPNREGPSTRRGVPSMDDYESLSHSKWECKYHVVFIPKCRRKTLYLELRRHLGDVFRKLAEQKESKIEEGHLLLDHVHMLISIPPKYAVSQVIGFRRR